MMDKVAKLYRFTNEKKKNVFLNNLISCGGNIGRAAAKSGITRQTHYNWLKEDARYAAVYENDVRPRPYPFLKMRHREGQRASRRMCTTKGRR